jgi:TolB-like protein/Flp pilus assembly protein TadD
MPSLPIAGMSSTPPSAYKFGGFSLLTADKQLIYDGKPVPLPPKAFDTLLLLVQNQGHLLEKDAFLKRLWPDSFVEEVALAHSISQVRKALRTGTPESEFIETVPKRGYRFIAAVEAVAPPADPRLSRTRLAVLPFENLSADAQREYVADGLTEEVIAALGQVDPEHFGVIGRTSMMAYKRTTKSLAEVGAEVNAEFLVESSIRFEGDRLRITSRLIRTSDQMQIWSASFDSEPPSVLEFQRELSTAIAHQVRLHLSPERLSALERRQPRQAEAYDLYLRGRFFSNQLSPLTTRRALEFYGQAIALDPNYALAWAGLAMAYAGSPINGDAPPLQMGPRAREAAAHAAVAAPALAETQTSLGVVKFWLDWDWAGAEAACRSAIALDSSSSLAHRMLGVVLSAVGRHEDAFMAMRRARELDPFDSVHHALSAQVAFTARDYMTAVECARQATLLNPEFWVAYYQLAQAYERLGQYDAALDALQKASPFSSGNSKVISLRGYVLAKLGRTGEAEDLLHTLEAVSREQYVPPYALALLHAGLNDREAAMECLERAYDAHDVHLVLLVIDPKWDTFREDARLLAIIERCAFVDGAANTRRTPDAADGDAAFDER